MIEVLVAVHVLAGIIVLGPITTSASLFPRCLRLAHDGWGEPAAALGNARLLHRLTSTYGIAAIVVPVFGLGAAAEEHVFGQAWLQAGIALTAVAAFVLIGVVIPGQRRLLAAAGHEEASEIRSELARLSAWTGIFASCWAATAVVMVVKPGMS